MTCGWRGKAGQAWRGFMPGAGLEASVNPNFGLRLEYEHLIKAGDTETDIGVATASLQLRY